MAVFAAFVCASELSSCTKCTGRRGTGHIVATARLQLAIVGMGDWTDIRSESSRISNIRPNPDGRMS